MGCGDWNDGMNLIGQHGKGESVWLAFFLYDVLTQFANLARTRGDGSVADRYGVEAGALRGNIEANAWDGEWYRRAYFDDGTPLGLRENQECQIDALPQSWSILSGAGTHERSQIAMDSGECPPGASRRSDWSSCSIRRSTSPTLNPGYIKGYVPGVRENGGQYTHAAIWTVMAFAAMGDVERAWELFSMINPVNHGRTSKEVAVYRVEPYVVAADVYAVDPHTRARRVDMVHRLGRMDVSTYHRIASRSEARSQSASIRATNPQGMGFVQDPLPISGNVLSYRVPERRQRFGYSPNRARWRRADPKGRADDRRPAGSSRRGPARIIAPGGMCTLKGAFSSIVTVRIRGYRFTRCRTTKPIGWSSGVSSGASAQITGDASPSHWMGRRGC